MDLVSIIIPTYNRAGWLEKAVESCINQTYPTVEIIVVDDGSMTEDARHVAEKFRGVVYRYQQNMGLGGARNTGLEISRGRYIQFLDDDDWLDPRCVDRKWNYLALAPEIGAVYSDLFLTDSHEKVLGRYFANKSRPLPEGQIFNHLLINNFIPVHSILWKKSVIEKVGGFPLRSGAEDWEVLVKASEITHFKFIDEPLGYYRLHNSNMSLNYSQQSRGDARVQQVVVASQQFSRLPRDAQIKTYVVFSRKQWLWGDKDLAIYFLRKAMEIQPRSLQVCVLKVFMILGRPIGRWLIRLGWKGKAALARPSATSYFLQHVNY